MTTGALIFAFDNERIDYVALAAWSADNIRRHLNLPVCLITDREVDNGQFDHVIRIDRDRYMADQRWFDDLDSTVSWHNRSRADSYDLSPWDQTLLLDADYVVASSQLQTVLAMPQQLICHGSAWDIVQAQPCHSINTFGRVNMPMSWATVMMFRRSSYAQDIFDIMQMIRDNWNHYRDLYNFGRGPYRNDYALSIAQHVVNGHQLNNKHIPWQLMSVMPQHDFQQIKTDHYRVEHQGRYVEISNMDFHAMGKRQLGDIIAGTA